MAGWIVKFDGPCSKCGTMLRAGEIAAWDNGRRKMSCSECPVPPSTERPSPALLDPGTAGRSARERYDRLMAKREEDLKGRWGDRVGGWINRFAAEPQHIAAWGIGARGEELLADALLEVPGLIALHDRRVRGTKGSIDHIVIAPAGVFVIDAKYYRDDLIELRNYGWFLRPDWRLTVGRRDKSKLARDMGWQVDAVTKALTEAGVDPIPPIVPVLCFIDARWPFFGAPDSFSGVLLESEKSLSKRLTQPVLLDGAATESLAQTLATALPPK